MKKSKPSQKKIEIMCINNDCNVFLSPTELPSELSLNEISYYKCPRCKGFMRKYSINIAKNLRSRENKRLVNDPYFIAGSLIGPALIFYVSKKDNNYFYVKSKNAISYAHNFGWNLVSKQYVNVYKKLLNE